MTAKIAIGNFGGVQPKVPKHSLPENGASVALNVRLTDSTIRGYYESIDSGVALEVMEAGRGAYTFFRSNSQADPSIAWLQWNDPTQISVLDIRYSDVVAYTVPDVDVVVATGDFIVYMEGDNISYETGKYESTTMEITHGTFDPATSQSITPASVLAMSQTVSASPQKPYVDPVSYSWAFASGDGSITIQGGTATLASAIFNASLNAPVSAKLDGSTDVVKEAVFTVTVTDSTPTTPLVATQNVTVRFTRRWVSGDPSARLGAGDGDLGVGRDWNFGPGETGRIVPP